MIYLLLALLTLQPILEPPVTTFTVDCFSMDTERFTLHIGYTSNAERLFAGEGIDFLTQVGTYADVLKVEAGALPVPDVWWLSFTEKVTTGNPAIDAATGGYGETIITPVDWSVLPECGQPPIDVPDPLPTPTSEPCEAVAINAGTGEPYCYTPDASGVIPLPPAYQ